MAMGDNYMGTGGTGSTSAYRSSPVQTICGGTNWAKLAGGTYNRACAAIKTDGTLWMWGDNSYGILGDGTTVHRSSPVQTIAGGTNWSQVSVSANYTVAIKTDGTLWTWGANSIGQLLDGSFIHMSSPIQITAGGNSWSQVTCGPYYTAAIKAGSPSLASLLSPSS